ncbi:MAG TPA: glutathione S-transferase family protein [Caulobacteraceae bacterium]|jgi:glutathione S-transferase
MKLYSGDLSPYSAKVRMQIYAKGLGADIPLERPTTFPTLAWRETSPIGRIPVLELAPGDVIPESEVISEYLEEVYPTPRLLGKDARESAAIRTISRLADIYLLNNMFMLSGQTRRSTRSDAVRDLLAGQVVRGVEALEKMIDGEGGYALLGRVTLADCTLVPALFMIENVLPSTDTPDPIPANPKVAAYWSAIQQDASAAKVLVELKRGLEERRQLIRRMAEKERAAAG